MLNILEQSGNTAVAVVGILLETRDQEDKVELDKVQVAEVLEILVGGKILLVVEDILVEGTPEEDILVGSPEEGNLEEGILEVGVVHSTAVLAQVFHNTLVVQAGVDFELQPDEGASAELDQSCL